MRTRIELGLGKGGWLGGQRAFGPPFFAGAFALVSALALLSGLPLLFGLLSGAFLATFASALRVETPASSPLRLVPIHVFNACHF